MKITERYIQKLISEHLKLLFESLQAEILEPMTPADFQNLGPIIHGITRLLAPGGAAGGRIPTNTADALEISDPFWSLLIRIAPNAVLSRFAMMGVQMPPTGRTDAHRLRSLSTSDMHMQLGKILSLPAFRVVNSRTKALVYSNIGTGATPGEVGESLLAGLLSQPSFRNHMVAYGWNNYSNPTIANLNDPDSILRIPAAAFPAVDNIISNQQLPAVMVGTDLNAGNLNFANTLYSISAKGSLNPTEMTQIGDDHHFTADAMIRISAYLLAHWLVGNKSFAPNKYKNRAMNEVGLRRLVLQDAWNAGVRSLTWRASGSNIGLIPYMRTEFVKKDDPVLLAVHASEMTEITVQLTNTGGDVSLTPQNTGRVPTSQIRTDPRPAPQAVRAGMQNPVTGAPIRPGARTTGLPTPDMITRESEFTGARRGNLSTDLGRPADPLVLINAPVGIIVVGDFKEAAMSGTQMTRLFGVNSERNISALNNIVNDTAKAYATYFTDYNRFMTVTVSITGLNTELKNLNESGPMIKVLLKNIADFVSSMESGNVLIQKQGTDIISKSKKQEINKQYLFMMNNLRSQFKKADEDFKDPQKVFRNILNMLTQMANLYNEIKKKMTSGDLSSIDPSVRLQQGVGGQANRGPLRRFTRGSGGRARRDTGPRTTHSEMMPWMYSPVDQWGIMGQRVQNPPTEIQTKLGVIMTSAADTFNKLCDCLMMILQLFDDKDLELPKGKKANFIRQLGSIKRLDELAGGKTSGFENKLNLNIFQALIKSGYFTLLVNTLEIIVKNNKEMLELVDATVSHFIANENNKNTQIDPSIADDFGGAKTKEKELVPLGENKIYEKILKKLLKHSK